LNVDVAGPAGRLEGILEGPDDATFAAVVCHPHPRFGGTMHTHAAYRLARAVRERHGAVLRFNYRGVGRSAGSWDAGRGEADDARAALAFLARERPGLPLVGCGFSFGAWMIAAAAGDDPRVRGLLLAGLALDTADIEGPVRDPARLTRIAKPLALVQAERDQFALPDACRDALAGSAGPRRIVVVPGATHLFTEDLPALQREAEAALDWLLGDPA
jgi:alpha/beta superfamily hydrolase